MIKAKKFDFHILCAAAISVLSTSVVYLPKSSDESPVLAMVAALILGLPIYILFVSLKNKINIKNDTVKKLFAVIIGLFVIYLAAKSFASTLDYFSGAVLTKTPAWLILLPFFTLVFYASVCGGDVVKKFTILGFVLIALLIIILIMVSFKNLDIRLISKPKLSPSFFKTVARYFAVIFIFSSEVLIFQKKGGEDKSFLKSTALGVFIGGVLLSIVVANSVLSFGENYSAKLKFPYSYAISTFSVGNLFTRLDGFAYFIILTLNFLKGALCILSCEYLLSPFKIKARKTLLFILCLLSLLLSLLL